MRLKRDKKIYYLCSCVISFWHAALSIRFEWVNESQSNVKDDTIYHKNTNVFTIRTLKILKVKKCKQRDKNKTYKENVLHLRIVIARPDICHDDRDLTPTSAKGRWKCGSRKYRSDNTWKAVETENS